MQESDNAALCKNRLEELTTVYRDGLMKDCLPFWINNCVDREYGGFTICLDRDGSILDTDKGMWQTCRFTWLLANLYNTVEQRQEWLDLAKHGIDFINKYGFDEDGRMFFQVTQDGRPLRKRRYIFTETFAAMAYAAYSKASGDKTAGLIAKELFDIIIRHITQPGLAEPKVYPGTRKMKGLGIPMILIVTAQVLRETINLPECDQWINWSINQIKNDFMKPEYKVVMENVGPNGEFVDHFDGRMITPGHAIEAAWFILHEAKFRGDSGLLETGLTILDWMWESGWDKEYGGIIYYRDVKGLPVQEYWHDMKFWWPQNEAIIATLLAYQLSGNTKYADWHTQIHNWSYKYFPDPDYGDWYGYLHRDGRISVSLKGNLWKGPFHLPRMLLYCWKLCNEMLIIH